MKIEGIAATWPSRQVTNADILAGVVESNAHLSAPDLNGLCNDIDLQLRFIGARTRHVRAPGDPALPYALDAARAALRDAGATGVDLLVYAGVGRGFIEPAMSYVVADALGLGQVHCFDVLDACMSWTRAAFLVQNLLEAGCYQSAMVVTCEMNVASTPPESIRMQDARDLLHRLPGLTVGEAATATVFQGGGSGWGFHFESVPEGQNLCGLPLPWYAHYAHRLRLPVLKPHEFYSFYADMVALGRERLKKAADAWFEHRRGMLGDVRHIFCHADQARSYQEWTAGWGLEDRLRLVFSEFGNCVSSSVPLGIVRARDAGLVRRGDLSLALVVSAGMSAACVDFIY